MTRADYQAARAALQNLAAAVVTAQTGTLTQQQLVEQMQQLERQSALAGNGSECGVLTDDGEFFQDCSAVGQSLSSGAMGVASKGVGQSPTAGVGEVAGGHGFATSGVDLDPLGQTPTRVANLPAADVPVDLPLSSGQGNGTPSDPHAPTMALSQSSQHDVHQTGGQPSAEPGMPGSGADRGCAIRAGAGARFLPPVSHGRHATVSATADRPVAASVEQLQEGALAIQRELATVIVGHEDVLRGVLVALLAGGHALLEGVPGLGKTLLVRTLADALAPATSAASSSRPT